MFDVFFVAARSTFVSEWYLANAMLGSVNKWCVRVCIKGREEEDGVNR